MTPEHISIHCLLSVGHILLILSLHLITFLLTLDTISVQYIAESWILFFYIWRMFYFHSNRHLNYQLINLNVLKTVLYFIQMCTYKLFINS